MYAPTKVRTTGPMDQWTNGPMVQWTNKPIVQGTNGPKVQWTTGPMDIQHLAFSCDSCDINRIDTVFKQLDTCNIIERKA